jgi:hypothetical protein
MTKHVRAELETILWLANLPPDAKLLTVGYGVTRCSKTH